MIYNAVLHEDLLTAALPAPVVLDTGVWRLWVSGEILMGFLYNISDIGVGTVGEPYDIIPDIPESVMRFEYEFTPDDIGIYPFTATPDLVSAGSVVSADLILSGTGLWNDRIITAVPSELEFEQIGSVEDTVKAVELSVINRKSVLDYPQGSTDNPVFEVEPLSTGRILQPAVTPEGGRQYYLHPDGSITTNPNGALAPIAYGYSGKWKIGTAP